MFENLIHNENIDEIHTSDAYFGKVLLNGENLLIPYINLGISNHELNESNNLKFIDYCYFVAIDFSFLKINDNIILDNLKNKYNPLESSYLGGYDMLGNQNVFDIEVQANKRFIQLVKNYKIDEQIWIPLKELSFPINLDIDTLNDFVNNKKLPENLMILFK